jgi:3-phosphoshikimate 1-carboxyvinyltransferase
MLSLSASQPTLHVQLSLPASKSESNRVLIMQGLSDQPIELHNLSTARDTRIMQRLLDSEGHVLDVADAGTTMRFLTAYFAAIRRDQILTGTPRMCKRPIGILVEALRTLGAEIEYWKQDGFPPLHIVSKGRQRLYGGELSMAGNVSSQFISAILMIAPILPGGLRLHLTGELTSRPYVEMTRSLMAQFQVATEWEGDTLVVAEQPYGTGTYTVESDWSAASYWYSFVALAREADVTLIGLREQSYQGDQAIASLMTRFGVHTEYTDAGVRLTKIPLQSKDASQEIDFTACPDLAQTIAVVAAATETPLRMTGLHTLRIKETDRIEALSNELGKFGVTVEAEPDACVIGGTFTAKPAMIHTYEDHRMAMAFAPLVLRTQHLTIYDPEVVEKSYPEFWDHVSKAGVRVMG